MVNKYNLKITDGFVKNVFKRHMLMRYKKVKLIPIHANSQKSLVLRQQFALVMLDLLNKRKRILNIDETWLNNTNFIRKKWRQHGTTNSVKINSVNPRISLILAF